MIRRVFGPIGRLLGRISKIRVYFVHQWLGIMLISVSAWMFSPRAGVMTAGIFILIVGAIAEADRGRRKD